MAITMAGDTRPIKIYEYVFFYRTIVFAAFSAAYVETSTSESVDINLKIYVADSFRSILFLRLFFFFSRCNATYTCACLTTRLSYDLHISPM